MINGSDMDWFARFCQDANPIELVAVLDDPDVHINVDELRLIISCVLRRSGENEKFLAEFLYERYDDSVLGSVREELMGYM